MCNDNGKRFIEVKHILHRRSFYPKITSSINEDIYNSKPSSFNELIVVMYKTYIDAIIEQIIDLADSEPFSIMDDRQLYSLADTKWNSTKESIIKCQLLYENAVEGIIDLMDYNGSNILTLPLNHERIKSQHEAITIKRDIKENNDEWTIYFTGSPVIAAYTSSFNKSCDLAITHYIREILHLIDPVLPNHQNPTENYHDLSC